MANMSDCMLRNLQRFIEYDLSGLVRWDQVSITIPADAEGNSIEGTFTLDKKEFTIRVDSSEQQPPLGRVTMDDLVRGTIDEATWNEMALEIRSWHAANIQRRGRVVDRSMRAFAHG